MLEYGCGWSSLIMHLALIENKKRLGKETYPRCEKPYQLISIDSSKKFMNICKKNLSKYSSETKLVNFKYSKVVMTKFNERYCTEYLDHPQENPDFIYIDGPSPFATKNKIENFTTNSFAQMPMLCDVLKYEHFLTPGTIIVLDGRTANARFLKKNFQRNWDHTHHIENDHHYFCLNEKPLGVHNKLQLNFYKRKK